VSRHSVRDSLDRDGFAVVRGVLGASALEPVRDAFDTLVERARAGDFPPPEVAQFVVDTEPFRLHRVVWCGGVDERLARLGAHPELLALAGQALRCRPGATLDQLLQQAHFKLPGDGVDFAWHQDASNRRYGSELWTDIDGRGSFVQMVIAVDPMSAENGGLRVIPGSHRLGFVADPDDGTLPTGLLDDWLDQAIDLTLEPGDVALFGPFLLHGSPPNRSAHPRRILIQGFALPGANRRVYPGSGTGVPRIVPEFS
jgi:ectoine hydroxylase-related dioxygenase (phytanoyl-CoA dioxygenase family)